MVLCSEGIPTKTTMRWGHPREGGKKERQTQDYLAESCRSGDEEHATQLGHITKAGQQTVRDGESLLPFQDARGRSGR